MADDDRHLIRDAARLTIRGMTLGIAAWAATAGVRELMKRRAEEAIELAGERGIDRIPRDLPTPTAPSEAAAKKVPPAKAAPAKAAPAKVAPAKAAAKTPAKRAAKKAAPAPMTAPAPTAPPAEIDLRDTAVPAPAGPPAAETIAPAAAMTTPKPVEPPVEPVEPVEPPESIEAAQTEPEAAAELPIADFDTITVPSLRGRFRRLSRADLEHLKSHESSHGKRAEILSLLDNRLAKLDEA